MNEFNFAKLQQTVFSQFLFAEQIKKYLCLSVCLSVPDFEFRDKIVFTMAMLWSDLFVSSSCRGLESPIHFIRYCYCDGRRLDWHPMSFILRNFYGQSRHSYQYSTSLCLPPQLHSLTQLVLNQLSIVSLVLAAFAALTALIK